MEFCINPSGRSKQKQKFALIFLASFLYCSWEIRNQLVFSNNSDFRGAMEHFNRLVEDFLGVEPYTFSSNKESSPVEKWSRPPQGGSRLMWMPLSLVERQIVVRNRK